MNSYWVVGSTCVSSENNCETTKSLKKRPSLRPTATKKRDINATRKQNRAMRNLSVFAVTRWQCFNIVVNSCSAGLTVRCHSCSFRFKVFVFWSQWKGDKGLSNTVLLSHVNFINRSIYQKSTLVRALTEVQDSTTNFQWKLKERQKIPVC